MQSDDVQLDPQTWIVAGVDHRLVGAHEKPGEAQLSSKAAPPPCARFSKLAASIRSPIDLSMLRQYSNTRRRMSSRLQAAACPATLSTSRLARSSSSTLLIIVLAWP